MLQHMVLYYQSKHVCFIVKSTIKSYQKPCTFFFVGIGKISDHFLLVMTSMSLISDKYRFHSRTETKRLFILCSIASLLFMLAIEFVYYLARTHYPLFNYLMMIKQQQKVTFCMSFHSGRHIENVNHFNMMYCFSLFINQYSAMKKQ